MCLLKDDCISLNTFPSLCFRKGNSAEKDDAISILPPSTRCDVP